MTPAHACYVYATVDELLGVVAPYLTAGLAQGERCWYVSRGDELPQLRVALEQRNIDVEARLHDGALKLFSPEDVYASLSPFSPESMMSVFNDAIVASLHDGFMGFRAAGEMTWANRPDIGADLLVYEALISTLLTNCRAKGLCLFPRDARYLQEAIAIHPMAATAHGKLTPNPAHRLHAG